MKPASRLGSQFENLEDRSLPSTFGVPWADAEHLTLSFASDGTQTPLGANSLNQVLTTTGTSAQWQREILRAYQAWAAHANINLALVSDGGQALGSVGAVEGDSRFGDIRVAAAKLSADVLASTSPFSWIGTTLAGDMVLNANAPFSINSSTGYDLYSVAVHEAGHSFGLAHAGETAGPGAGLDPSTFHSVLDESYALQTGLSAQDIAAIQLLYGARRADAYDAAGGNDTSAKASAIPRNTVSQLLATGDLTTADVDYYKFTAPALTATLSAVTVRLKTQGLSLLTANVTVYDSAGRVVTSAKSTDPLNNDLVLSFRPGLLGGNYTIKVEGARNDDFDIGAYKLSVDFLSLGGLLSPITTTLVGVLDGHTDDILANALGLKAPTTSDARFDAIYRGVIEDTSDVDSYKIRTDKFAAGTAVTLNVMVWGLDSNPLDGRVRVYDANGKAIAFQVLANDRGLFSVQVLNAVAGKDYFVQVSAREGAVKNTGSYFFAADFNKISPMVFDNVASGSLKASQVTTTETLTLSEAGVFQFALGATSSAGDTVTMTVYGANGSVLFTLTSTAGRPPVTATKYMTAGTYTVKYSAGSSNLSTVNYALFLAQVSDGVGPYTTSTASPSGTTSPDSTSSTSTTYSAPPPDQQPMSAPPPSDTSTSSSSSTTTTAPPPSSSTSTSTTTSALPPQSPPPSSSTTTSAPPPSNTSTSSSTTTTSGSSTPPASDPNSAPMMPPPPPPSYSYSGSSTSQPSGYYYTY